jgi:osmotically-inducible protein OsmY
MMPAPPLLYRLDKALRSHPHLNRQNVFLENERDYVVVRGTVQTFFQKQMIQEAIRKVDGNAEIKNLIEVR